MKMNSKPFFAADSIGKSFGEKNVLRNASMWGWPGRVTALLGRNGCGKSTLMRAAVGALKHDFGVIRVDESIYEHPRLHILARHGVYYVADYGGIPLDVTVRTLISTVEGAFNTSKGLEWVDALGLTPYLDQRVMELSGGECKRVEIAAALTRNPRCLLADEPFAGISPIDAEQIANGFRALCKDGCAIIITGHEIPNILDIADEIIWVTSGTTHVIGDTSAAKNHYQFCTEYLGVATHHA